MCLVRHARTRSQRRIEQSVEVLAQPLGVDPREMSSSLDELRCRWSSPGQWAQFSNRDTVPGDGHGLSARNGIEYLSAAIAKIPHTDGCHEGSVSPVRHSSAHRGPASGVPGPNADFRVAR